MVRGEAKESLRQSFLELGFDEARFTGLSGLEENRLREWLERGYHADMEWLRRSLEKRLNPQLVQEGACAAIMLGVNYYPSEAGVSRQGRWAKYSLHQDYHDTMLNGLRAAGAELEKRFGLSRRDYRYYVDTGPVMERGWAAAAGIGWQGKNGMLISKEHGNWLLLAAILVNLEIEDDPAVKKPADQVPPLGALCGKCVRCIDACPTDAIPEPGLVDANRCISYQTIENKGVIPRSLRPGIGSRVFGCDVCLDVCPWNRFAQSGRQVLLATRYEIVELDLLRILGMEAEEFREVFRRTPMKRLKLRGLLRNACVAAGNLKQESEWLPEGIDFEKTDPEWRKLLRERLLALAQRDETIVRPHAVWALYRLFGSDAEAWLEEARQKETDPAALEEYRHWETK